MSEVENLKKRVQLQSEKMEELEKINKDLTEEIEQMREIYVNAIDFSTTLENELEKEIEALTNSKVTKINHEDDHYKELRVRLSIEISKNEHLEKINKSLMEQIEQFRLLYVNVSAHSTALENDLDERYEEVKRLSITDPLTGVMNRSGFYRNIEAALELVQRKNQPLSLIMMDIDNFKSVNDEFGHDIGDEILTKVVTLTSQSIRKSDTITRWGGEEFLIIVPELKIDKAIELADRIRSNIEEKPLLNNKTITCSLGVSNYLEGEPIEQCIKRADSALYDAKKEGKNMVKGDNNG